MHNIGSKAIRAIVPKAYDRIDLPRMLPIPTNIGNTNVTAIVPEATPPESKAMPIKMSGTIKDKIMIASIIGTTNQYIEIAKTTFSVDNTRAKEIAAIKEIYTPTFFILPILAVVIWLARMLIAGSVNTRTNPKIAITIMTITKLFEEINAPKFCPKKLPIGANP